MKKVKVKARAQSSRRQTGMLAFVLSVVVFAAVWLVGMPEASACGGFFCNNQQPVRQAAERIIFSDNGDGTVTGVIQIRYQGPSSDFAWVLPVPKGDTEVGVSSNTALQRIKDATEPSYQMETTVKGNCKDPGGGGLFGAGATADSAPRAGGARNENDGVEEIQSGQVGPYDYKEISVSEQADDPADEALKWLEERNFDVSDLGPQLIREYLMDDMNLVAIKLTSDSDTGDIRPLKVTYEHPLPMIPIKLTAVAANQDMGVLVWLLGRHRGIPTKYKHLKINDAAINWFRWRANYDQVVTQAADEADGQGFVTEYADETSEVAGTILSDEERSNWQSFNDAGKWEGKKGEMLETALNRYAAWDGMRKALADSLPEDMDADSVMNNPDRAATSVSDDFDVEAFLTELDDHVVGPMRETEDLLQERDYVSRLYTTMSPDEMTKDPIFDFNADMEDVSNVHTAQRTVYCSNRVTRSNAPWKAELPSGEVVHGEGNRWPLGPNGTSNQDMPVTRTIETTGPSQDEVVEDNTDTIDEALSEHNSSISLDPGGCGGCSTSGESPPVGTLLMLLFAGGVVARRRRG